MYVTNKACDSHVMKLHVSAFLYIRSRAKNIVLLGLLGGKEFLQGTQRGFENRIRLEVRINCVCVCMCVYVCACMHVCVYMRILVCVLHMCLRVYVHTCACMWVRGHACVCLITELSSRDSRLTSIFKYYVHTLSPTFLSV